MMVAAGSAAVVTRNGLYAFGALAVAGALAVGLRSWRASLYGLMLYLPLSGILTLSLYPRTGPGTLAKDVLFLVPAYLGFLIAMRSGRRRISFSRAPATALGLIGVLAVVQILNPKLPATLVGLIGLKLYVFYLPLLWLGYHLIRDERDLWRTFAIISLGAIVPCTIGIAESALIVSNQADTVYQFYGAAAGAATQNFQSFTVGSTTLSRVPSTFTYWVQYWMYTALAVAAAYGWLRGSLRGSPHAWIGAICLGLAAVGGMTSGSRGAFLFIPLLLIMIAVLDDFQFTRAVGVTGAVIASAAAAVTVLGVGMGPLYELVSDQAVFVSRFFVDSVRAVGDFGLIGIGTGVDSIAARYAFDAGEEAEVVYAVLGGLWYESWWIKFCLELGLAGLICLLVALYRLIAPALAAHRRMRHARFRSASAVMLGLVLWNLVYSFKTQYIDTEPMNIYFWLFLGMLAALPELDRRDGGLMAVARVGDADAPRLASRNVTITQRPRRRSPVA